MLLIILMGKNCWKFLIKKSQKSNQKEFGFEKVIKRKGDELCVKWKGHNNSFNSWIDKERHNIKELIFSQTKIFRSKCKS